MVMRLLREELHILDAFALIYGMWFSSLKKNVCESVKCNFWLISFVKKKKKWPLQFLIMQVKTFPKESQIALSYCIGDLHLKEQ